jgi:hypothetical protein
MLVEHRQLHAHSGIHGRELARPLRRTTTPVEADTLDEAADNKQQNHQLRDVRDDRQHRPAGARIDPTGAGPRTTQDDRQNNAGGKAFQPPPAAALDRVCRQRPRGASITVWR